MTENLLQANGARDDKQSKWAPIYNARFFLGLVTNRNPLRSPAGIIYENYYHIGTTDAMISGVNVELSNRLTVCRRPGNTAGLSGILSSATLPGIADSFYSFHELNGTVRVFIDTAATSYLWTTSSITPIFTKAAGAGQSYYQGVGQSLYFTDLKEQQKWIDSGAGTPGNSYAAITNTALTSNVATITSVNNFAVGQTVEISSTTNGSGAFNGTVVVTFVPHDLALRASSYFQFALSSGDIAPAAETGFASGTWNWGIAPPTTPPNIVITESGAAATTWVASTWFSTMGLLVDSNGNVEQLNAITNGTSFGESSTGQPPWSQTTNTTTADNGVSWLNAGPLAPWAPNTGYANQSAPGVNGASSCIWDQVTGTVYSMFNAGNASGISGSSRPGFTGILHSTTNHDGSCKWYCRGNGNFQVGGVAPWTPSTTVAALPNENFVCEPINIPVAAGLPLPSQPIYIQYNTNSGTTSSSLAAPSWSPAVGGLTTDNELVWVNLGSATWEPSTSYNAWTSSANTAFSVVKDANGSLQVCIQSGVSSGSAPFVVWQAGHVYAVGQIVVDTNSNTQIVTVSGTSGGSAPTWATVKGDPTTGDGGVSWQNQGSAYGTITIDNTARWVNVGQSSSWVANSQYYLPKTGFNAPSTFDPYGSSDVNDGTNIEFVVQSGFSDSTTPSWMTGQGEETVDNTVVWFNNGPFVQDSLDWTTGHNYVYAFKSRDMEDEYSPAPLGTLSTVPIDAEAGGLGGGLIPPLWGQALGFPTGSADGSVSTASPAFIMPTGSNAGAVVTVSGVGSTDPQVDTIEIYRTADGGATYFLLTDIPNPPVMNGLAGTWTINDTMPDNPTTTLPGLQTLTIAALVNFNNPPPTGFVNITEHLGRIWGSVGSTVFASNGPLVGGSSQPPGNGYTSFNPGQFWTFPSVVTKLVPTTSGLLVFTTSDLFIINGGPNIITIFSNILIPGIGLSSYNALATQGGLIYLLTADNQGISLDPNMGVSEIGFPIGDQLETFSSYNSYVAFLIQGSSDKGLYFADGSTGWFRCNPNQAPDSAISGPVWSPKANIVGGCGAIASLEVSPGKHALVIGSTSTNQPILVRDSTYTTFSDNGTSYPANFTFGSIVLAQPGQLAELGFVTCEFIKTGTSPKLSVLLNEISGSFEDLSGYISSTTNLPPQDPPLIYGLTEAPTSTFANRYYFAQSVAGEIPPQGTSCRHLQMQIDYGSTDLVQNQILSQTLFGSHWSEP